MLDEIVLYENLRSSKVHNNGETNTNFNIYFVDYLSSIISSTEAGKSISESVRYSIHLKKRITWSACGNFLEKCPDQ